MKGYHFKPGDKVRLLEPQVKHHHTLYDYKTDTPVVICTGPNCWLCESIKKLTKVPWYRCLWRIIKEKLFR